MAALAVAGVKVLVPGLVTLPVVPILLVVGAVAFVLIYRELSGVRRFERQARDHERAVRELNEKMRWLNMTEEKACVGHWRLDLETDEVFWSTTTFAIHGMKAGSPPDLTNAIEFYHPDDRAHVMENIERSRDTGDFQTFRARLLGADGVTRHVETEASTEFDETGNPVALFGVLKDRTAEERMQAELRKARDDAHALAQSKGLFLARMSHEIRTPMNGVLGFAELLGRSNLSSEQKRHTDFIVESGKSLQALLNDILDLSKIESGKIEINPGTVDIHHLVYRVTQMAEPTAREKAIKLAYDTSPDVPRHVVLDALRLRQILSNLLANAVRFTDEGGVSVSLRCVEGKLRFAVCDTGTGIAASMLDQIFDPFTQERNHPTSSRGGTGLGLAISRQLAELMGGTLTVRSEPGEGSVFSLTLPLIGAAAPPQSKDDSSSAISATLQKRGARVLLAEDYDINRELITEMTRQLGIEIECAEDGVEAVAMVRHAQDCGQPYALVLMDLQMPRLDGLEATRDLRQAGIGEDQLPIIALTANAFADDIENCLAAGMQAHLAKPLSIDRLDQALNKWMPASTDMTPEPATPVSLR
ncbi:MAG: ATP-binding protein [Erythrobacter sp.]